MPCYNSERTIRPCLTSILNQRTSIPFDILVVDSSQDDTAEIVRREFPTVKLIRFESRKFAGVARNAGMRATRAKYCLMLDSDCVASPEVVEKSVARHGEGDYAAVGGSLRNGTPRSPSGWVGYLMEFKEFMPTMPLRLERSVPSACVTYRRETLERFGGFDEDMWLAEDILLHWRMVQSGEKILFDPSITVTHLNRTGWKAVLSYQVSLGRLSAAARKRGGLPGTILFRHPILHVLMPLVRTYNAAKWLVTHDWKVFWVFLCLSPLYLVATTFWSYGFFKEVTSGSIRPYEPISQK